MSRPDKESLYNLLPAIYRSRDAEYGEPLRALFATIEMERETLEEDIGHLYENWFIETCDEWVVPYIGDLLGIQGMHAGSGQTFSLRAFVANTLAYRRRKGTNAVLEQVARDLTGWNARAVEYLPQICGTQNVNTSIPPSPTSTDIRSLDALDLFRRDMPFESLRRTVDVRHIANLRGRYNIKNNAIFLWWLTAYVMDRSTGAEARRVDELEDNLYQYTFNPLGIDMPLLNEPQTETEITHLAEEINVPGRLRRLPLYLELKQYRDDVDAGRTPGGQYFGTQFGRQPVIEVMLQTSTQEPSRSDGQQFIPESPENIHICNLGGKEATDYTWRTWNKLFDLNPDSNGDNSASNGGNSDSTDDNPAFFTVAIDPERGRLLVNPIIDDPPGVLNGVLVRYTYAGPGDIGGGPYERETNAASASETQSHPHIVRKDYSDGASNSDLATVISELPTGDGSDSSPSKTVIEIEDSAIYTLSGPLNLGPGEEVTIQAANGCRPVLILGDSDSNKILDIQTPSGDARSDNSERLTSVLTLRGLLIEGGIHVHPGALGYLNLIHTTLVPGRTLQADATPVTVPDSASITVEKSNPSLEIFIDHSIVGPLHISQETAGLSVQDSVIDGLAKDGPGKLAICGFKEDRTDQPAEMDPTVDGIPASGFGPATTLTRTTIMGSVDVQQLDLASNVIFERRVWVERKQTGLLRFCYVPQDSIVPRQINSQPKTAIKQIIGEDVDYSTDEAILLAKKIRPSFISQRYGRSGYGRLSRDCPMEIRAGGDNGSEMGAFNYLLITQRESNLRTSLDEYMRFGLEAGIQFVNT
ncbi:MAG: hypothetical protein IIA59_09385 [Candidatus Marinimicrobia bacterium]|nr:hypothetical protein [Candidatus Neomarinimicrobiota bacterium]